MDYHRLPLEEGGEGDVDAEAQGTAHIALYGMAECECATLSEIFKGECRHCARHIIFPVVTPANAPANAMTAPAFVAAWRAGLVMLRIQTHYSALLMFGCGRPDWQGRFRLP